jgi:CRISPR/Cas system-associated exonuclease Cas4 (RecB family)
LRRISYSFLHLFACPYAAFLRYEAGLRGPTTKHLALGNAIHLALEEGHKAPEWGYDSVSKLFLKEFTRIINDDEVFITWPEIKKFEADGLGMLATYDSMLMEGKISPPEEIEYEFELPYFAHEGQEDILIVGRIDAMDKGSVTDYKSGQKEPDPWFLRHNLQFTVYAWAHQEKYGFLPRDIYWHHLRNGKLLRTERTQEDIDGLKTMLQNVIDMQDKDIRYRVFHEQVCSWCDFRGEICDDKDLEARTVLKKQERLGRIETKAG